MYLHKFLDKVKIQLKKHPVSLVINHSFTDLKSLLINELPNYRYISLQKTSYLNLLKNDPYKFFNLYAEKIIFEHIELEQEFISLLMKYSMSVYRSENYLLISGTDLSATDKNLAKIKLYPDEKDNGQTPTLPLESWFTNPISISRFLKKTEPFVSFHHTDKIMTLLKLLSKEIDQALNVNRLANELNVSQPSVQHWVKSLEKAGIVYLLPSFTESFGKRCLKAPKVYFTSLALANSLLGIRSEEELLKSKHFFQLVNNFYVLELVKKNELEINPKAHFYWKESNGHEIPFLFQNPTSLDIFEFISSHEVLEKDFRELDYFDYLTEGAVLSKTIIYDGFQEKLKQNTRILPWRKI